jgi:phospholipid transport system substrate-binding protein
MMTIFKSRSAIPTALAVVLTLAAGLFWPGTPAAAAGETPRSVAEQLDAALLEGMRNAKTLGYEGRYELLAPVLEESFDFPFMARVSIGRYWRKMDEVQQAKLVESFARLSIATFAARFDGYSGETFRVLGQEEGLHGTILVVNHLIKSDGEAIAINYLMRQTKGRWRIVDVFLKAKYSELAIKRSEYTSVYKRDGFARLIEIMETKIAGYSDDDAS